MAGYKIEIYATLDELKEMPFNSYVQIGKVNCVKINKENAIKQIIITKNFKESQLNNLLKNLSNMNLDDNFNESLKTSLEKIINTISYDNDSLDFLKRANDDDYFFSVYPKNGEILMVKYSEFKNLSPPLIIHV